MFIPIGSYYLIENDIINLLDPSDVSAQVQNVILREPIRKVRSIEEIKHGHSIADYLDDIINRNKLEPHEDHTVESINFFEPKIEGDGKILWENQKNGLWECQLIARGKHLWPVQLGSKQNILTGTPFSKNPHSIWVSVSCHKNEKQCNA